jgi:hypothetical protein
MRWFPLEVRDTVWYAPSMARVTCEECKAIYEEMVRLVEASSLTKPGPDATPQQLGEWFDQRDADEEARMQERLTLATLSRRLMEHCKQTGHNVPSPLPHLGLNRN